MASHPKHPPCPKCGRALYKSATVGAVVKKTDPWGFCRNAVCAAQSGTLVEVFSRAPLVVVGGPEDFGGSDYAETPILVDATPIARTPVADDLPPPQPEHPAVKVARVRIREILFQVIPGKFDPSVVGLTLAIVSQETGNHRAANALIAEYNLTEKYGIQSVRIPNQ